MRFTLAHKILRKLLKDGMTQAEVARRAERSRPAVSLWMSKGSRPDGDARQKLADIIPPDAWSKQ